MTNLYLNLCVRKPTIWVPTRSDTNRPVQSQKYFSDFKEEEDCTIHVAKIKALISFGVMQIFGFLMQRLIYFFIFDVHKMGVSLMSPLFV